MTPEQQSQQGELQKTLLIPVLSLQIPGTTTAMDSNPGSGIGSIESHREKTTHTSAADLLCEQIVRTSSAPSSQTNPILAAATTLISMAARLRSAAAPRNITQLSQLLIDAVRDFDRNLLHVQLHHETALVARYILCSTIDESVLSTPWGISSGWAHRSLLRLFHNESNGGDRFFALLEHAMQRQQQCRELLELFYLCLSLGFEGKLHLDPRGHDKIETLRMQLYRLLYQELARKPEFSTRWRPPAVPFGTPKKQKPLRTLIIVVATLIACSFCGLRLWLDASTDSVIDVLQHAFRYGNGIRPWN